MKNRIKIDDECYIKESEIDINRKPITLKIGFENNYDSVLLRRNIKPETFDFAQTAYWLIGIGLTIGYLYDKSKCNAYLSKTSGYIKIIFKYIGIGFRMLFDMILNSFKQICPIIHWK